MSAKKSGPADREPETPPAPAASDSSDAPEAGEASGLAAPADAPEPEAGGAAGRVLTRPEILRAWWRAARPPFYIATLIPLFLGYFAARNDAGDLSALVMTGVLLVGFLLHLAANLANDLYDYLLGTDTGETIGGSRGLQEGSISVPQLRRALAACYGLAACFTLLGVWLTGLWGLFFIALFGALAGYCYVAPPVRYGYRALGELFAFLSMGLVMTCGAYYALTGEVSSRVLALSIPVGLMVAGILYYQSLPEIETDAAAGKTTLAVALGPVKAVFLFKLWWPAVWTLILTLYLADLLAWPALLGIALGLPLHFKACARLDAAGGDWLGLDRYGKYVRLMYLAAGLGMLVGVAAP